MSPFRGPPSPTVSLSQSRAQVLKDQLVGRLFFLRWIANRDVHFFTSTDQTDIIWDCLIADPIGRMERDEAFLCLEGINDYENFTNHFFHNRLPQLDVRYFSEPALKYAKTCLMKVNRAKENLRVVCGAHAMKFGYVFDLKNYL
jgi:hypothetical protein